ncbi:MAG: 50S ribosomal protein L14e [Thermoproteota archaeon]|nr:50S ribosomal protein L14e [Candidatus Brockarchaeota archaeon]MBO3768734.1 50S ribosomal protein L14e [Candidatus Brockarchaeota archaeon]MBO3801038.1 50S ribosomal protein L14e [Candidatus Brockarchaeota archaeon]
MALISVGRICVKTKGRDAGKKCVVVSIINDNFVLVTGPKKLTGVRRRKVNIRHLSPLPKHIRLPKDASDDVVLSALEKNNLVNYMKGEEVIESKNVEETEETNSS